MEIVRFDKKYQEELSNEIVNLHLEVSWLSSRNGESRGVIILAKSFGDVMVSDYVFFEDDKQLMENCPSLENILYHFTNNHVWRSPSKNGEEKILAIESIAGASDIFSINKDETPHIFYGN